MKSVEECMLNSLRSVRAFTATVKKRPDRKRETDERGSFRLASTIPYALVKVDDDSECNDIFSITISISWNRCYA